MNGRETRSSFRYRLSGQGKIEDVLRKGFGWKAEPYGPLSYRRNTGSKTGIQGFTTALGHEPHHYVMFYVEVDDIPAHLAMIESNGGQVVVPKTDIPGSGRFAWFKDPEGNLAGLWESAA